MAEETPAPAPKKGGNTVLIIIIGLLIFLLLFGGIAAFLLLGDDTPPPQQQQVQQQGGGNQQQQARSTNMLTIGPIYPMDPFIVNLLSESGSRYLKVTLDIELSSDKLANELNVKRSPIRDIMIKTLSSKTFEEIITMKGKARLKDEMTCKMNEILTDGFVKNVFFTDFVVQ